MTSNYGTTTDIAINNAGDIVFDVRVEGDIIHVSGTEAGETVALCDMSRRIVKKVVANGVGTTILVSDIAEGIYIVKTAVGAKKIRIQIKR